MKLYISLNNQINCQFMLLLLKASACSADFCIFLLAVVHNRFLAQLMELHFIMDAINCLTALIYIILIFQQYILVLSRLIASIIKVFVYIMCLYGLSLLFICKYKHMHVYI